MVASLSGHEREDAYFRTTEEARQAPRGGELQSATAGAVGLLLHFFNEPSILRKAASAASVVALGAVSLKKHRPLGGFGDGGEHAVARLGRGLARHGEAFEEIRAGEVEGGDGDAVEAVAGALREGIGRAAVGGRGIGRSSA